jgi:fucose permease
VFSSSAHPSRLLTLCGYGGFVLIGWNAVLLPSLIRSIEHQFKQSDAAFGLLYFTASLVYACGAFSGGFLTERLGRRAVLGAGVLALGAGLGGEGIAPTWVALVAALVPASWGGGVIDGGVNALFLDLYRDARGGALNLLHVFFSLGALVSPFVVGQLITAGIPWRMIFFGTGVWALPLAALLAVVGMPSGRHERRARETARGDAAEQSLLPFAGLALSIGLYVAAEVAVSSWLVKLLVGVPVATATQFLSVFWAGLALGRLLSNRLAERIDYYAFTVGCIVLASLALLGAVFVPLLPLAGALFGLTGVFFGPIYPMIMALGGNIYPRRLAALSGGLAAAAVAGSIVYPPLMGLMASHVGLRAGMAGAALLGIPMALALLGARAAARRASVAPHATLEAARPRRAGR